MTRRDEPPRLRCPECGAACLTATHRGRHDDDENYIAHRDDCRCRWCDWMWGDDQRERCECGVMLGVEDDDGRAYAWEIAEEKAR